MPSCAAKTATHESKPEVVFIDRRDPEWEHRRPRACGGGARARGRLRSDCRSHRDCAAPHAEHARRTDHDSGDDRGNAVSIERRDVRRLHAVFAERHRGHHRSGPEGNLHARSVDPAAGRSRIGRNRQFPERRRLSRWSVRCLARPQSRHLRGGSSSGSRSSKDRREHSLVPVRRPACCATSRISQNSTSPRGRRFSSSCRARLRP
jgi:hypothetical protein